jgi:prepilin-type N-terminal cleavage/methylation domain-containing protein
MHQQQRKHPHKRSQCGFTLIEIIIAVMILAVSLTTLLGMQSAATQTAIKTRNKQEAMLAARTILSGIEFAGDTVRNTTAQGTASEIALRFLSKEAVAPIVAKEQKIPLRAKLVIEYWPMQDLRKEALQRVTLTMSWSSQPGDSMTFYYFITARELEQ